MIFSQAVPLTDLLKKNQTLHWSKECQRAFKDLKKAITEELVLVLPDHTKSFKVQTKTFDFTIDGVLMQKGQPIAFKSWKLNDVKCHYAIQEKEMAIIIHCL